MDAVTIKFKADGQQLTRVGSDNFAANTVSYIRGEFELGDNWSGFDSVRAVWATDFAKVATVLDGSGACVVPWEVLNRTGTLYVNLVGSISDGDELTDRLTTYKAKALDVNGCTNVEGTETAPLTPSQFEQFVAIVEQLVGSVKDIDRCVLNADYTLTIYYSDGTSDTVGPIRGEQGATGPAGNGISSIAKIGSTGTNPVIDTYRITYTNGTHTDFTVTNGLKGDTGATGNGIESVYLTATHGAVKTYTILFTDGTTTTFQVTDGEVTLAQLSAVLPTDTASGAIASFPDGSDLFDYLSCIVDIDSVQDLHGYDKPWVGGAGANKWDEEWEQGGLDANGEPIAQNNRIRSKNYIPVTANADYYILMPTSTYGYLFFYDANKAFLSNLDSKRNQTFTTPAGASYMKFYAWKSGWSDPTYANDMAINYPSSVTTYTPYSNICPITGWTGCEVVQTGFNVWDEEWEVGEYNNNGVKANTGFGIRSKNYIPVKPSINLAFINSLTLYICEYDENKTFIQRIYVTTGSPVKQVTSNTHYVTFNTASAYGTTYNNDISINYPSTDTAYHAYNGAVYPITWQTEAGTVYGGTVDAITGELIDTLGSYTCPSNVALTKNEISGQTTVRYYFDNKFTDCKTGELVSSLCSGLKLLDEYAPTAYSKDEVGYYINGQRVYVKLNVSTVGEAQAILNGLVFHYELATPIEYNLTATPIPCLLGQNNVWADCGDVDEVKYKADVQLYIEKMLNS